MVLKVESSELIHALFGLWGFRRLLFTLWFLEGTQEQAAMKNTAVLALYGHRLINLTHNSPKAPPGVSSASRSPETVDLWVPGT